MTTIDQYSVSTVPVELLFNDIPLGIGTAFVWQASTGQYFLVSNWHNFSGKDPFTGKHKSKDAVEPNTFRVWWNAKAKLGDKFATKIRIREQDSDRPMWLVHPQHSRRVDVAAISVQPHIEAEMYPINKMPSKNILTQVGMDVFVLGYPFGLGRAGLPIWKRGSLASEPEVFSADELYMLVDTASRPGMSGSPVIQRSWGTHFLGDGNIEIGTATATKLIGVYSGRIQSGDPLDAQLGLVWPVHLVEEIVANGRMDS